jgi:hypothetical protein
MVAGELHGWVCGSVIDGFLFVLLGLLVCGKLEVAVASFQFETVQNFVSKLN